MGIQCFIDIFCPYCSGFSGMGRLANIRRGIRANQEQLNFQDDFMRELLARSISAELRTSPPSFVRWTRASNRTVHSTALPWPNFGWRLDNVRMTAWTVSELHNARESQKDPQLVISFLTAERLRRFGQMARTSVAISNKKAVRGLPRPSTILGIP